MMNRAHKIRLNPTPEQEQYFRQAAGNARFAWNWALAILREARKRGKNLPLIGDLKTQFNRIKRDQFPFMMNTTKCAPEQAFADLQQAVTNYFNDIKKRKNGNGRKDGARVGFPVFKSRKPRVLGVDIGVTSLAVDSDGEVFENQKHLTTALRKLRRLNRWLVRKQKGSRNWQKARRTLARMHLRIANLRADAIHKMTTRLVGKADTIGLETLNVAGMLRNRKRARAIADAAFGEITRQLDYKAVQIVRVNRFYPSSKTCNECGHINHDLTLANRVWTCPGCDTRRDRDVNAARNIRDEGIRLVSAA